VGPHAIRESPYSWYFLVEALLKMIDGVINNLDEAKVEQLIEFEGPSHKMKFSQNCGKLKRRSNV
jgi:acylphosphatase